MPVQDRVKCPTIHGAASAHLNALKVFRLVRESRKVGVCGIFLLGPCHQGAVYGHLTSKRADS
eukprot:scaffold98987_cov29-Tisochrysis_lutea.AAC.4